MKLIIGLGNPGLGYSNTRHNIGFKVVKLLSKKLNIRIGASQSGAKVGTGSIDAEKLILALPQKYMNVSGEPVKALVHSRKIEKNDLLVVCDDVNLEYGTLRLRLEGSAGGHNGLKSIIECLGTDKFARLRVGVGPVGANGHSPLQGDITNFVLGNFTSSEKVLLDDILEQAVLACESWVNHGTESTWRVSKG